jgi:hypothetical protein
MREGFKATGTAVVKDHLRHEQLARVRAMTAAGASDFDICADLDVAPSELKGLKSEMLAQEALLIVGRPVEDIFTEYKLRMDNVCHDLDAVKDGATASGQYTAAMGALKAKANIIDKVIDRGQDMGLIARAAQRHEVAGGVAVAHLTDGELMLRLREINAQINTFESLYGEGDIQDVAVPDIYRSGS